MRCRLVLFLFLALLAGFLLIPAPASAQQSCENLKSVNIPNVTLTMAAPINPPPDFAVPNPPGPFRSPTSMKVSVPFCRVVGFSAPTKDSHIGFEVWLPHAKNWNGKYLGIGNPGFIGSISHGGLANNMLRGYATAATDTGHVDVESKGEAPSAEWSGNREKIIDWGHRAVHETTVAAKQLIKAYYGSPAKYSYWNSCHEGGNQALTEAQRYPEDFDGIVAGDPAFYITHLQSISEYITWVSLKDGVKAPGYIPPAKYPAMHRAVLDSCDALDGVRDNIIEDPTRCRYDPKTIQCAAGIDELSCLTAPQVETAKKIYAGSKFKDGTPIYSGLEMGSELGWGLMNAGPEPLSLSNGFFQSMVFGNPKWDFRTFDVDRDVRLAEKKLGDMVDSKNPNLKPFKDHGGKIIMYQSWDESIIPPRSLMDYYKNVLNTMGGQSNTQDFARLFMVSGMGMCPGFMNAKSFNTQEAIEQWVEKGNAPDKIIAARMTGNEVHRTHPICPYPEVAIYKGIGDTSKAENFTCGIPKW